MSDALGKGLAAVLIVCLSALALTATVAGCVALWNAIL